MKRPLRRFVVRLGVAVATISMVCTGATQLVSAAPQLVVIEVTPTAAISQTPTTVGVADSAMYFYTDEQIDETLDALQAMGVQNVRIMIPWAGVQLFGPDSYFWDNVDREVNAASARNMGVLGVLEKTPWWAGSPPLNGQPRSPQEYANFAGQVAERYKGKISAYEIWNEPNGRQFLNPVSPAGYTELLKAAYPAIKEADPSATVIGAVVGAVLNAGPFLMNPVDFVAGMYAAGAHGYFDALSFHPYSYTLEFSKGTGQAGSPLRQLMKIRDLMVANGDKRLKVWATEYGQPTSEGGEQKQAAFTEDFLNSWQTVDGTGPIFLYTTRDINSYSTAPDETLGLFFDNGQPKLAAYVVAEFLGGRAPGSLPSRPFLTAIGAVVYELARITRAALDFAIDAGKAIARALVDAVKFVVDATVSVIRGVVDFTVDVVQAGVQAIRDVVDRITDRLRPPGMAVAALSDDSAPVALRADAIDPAGQRSSAQAGSVAVGDAVDAGTVSAVKPSSTDKSGDVPAGEVTAGAQTDATGVDHQESAEPTTVAKPTTLAESRRRTPSDDANPSTTGTAVGESTKTAVRRSQTTEKEKPGSTPDAKPATAGGDGSPTAGAEKGGSTG